MSEMRGAIYDDGGLRVRDDVTVRAPEAGEVVVDLRAAGVCHSDLKLLTGATRYPTPVVMGHEGAGVVAEVGPGVTAVAPGDSVVLHTLRSCGACPACASGRPTVCRRAPTTVGTPFRSAGVAVHQFANTSVFVERTVVAESQVVAVDPSIPADKAALLGCGVLTGVGAVRNRARVDMGETVAVLGVGGVGLNAVQGAALAGASQIVAVDTNPEKEGIARRFGATDFVAGGDGAATAAALADVVPGGLDCVLICIGVADLVRLGVDVLAPGGRVVVVGFPGGDAEAGFTLARLYQDKSVLACRYGSSSPHRDIPLLADLYLAGKLRLDELVTHIRPLEELPAAFDDMRAGRTEARTVVTI